VLLIATATFEIAVAPMAMVLVADIATDG